MLPKPKNKRLVYLDHAATTYLDQRVLAAMRPYFIDKFGNPSALYAKGREVNEAINDCRRRIASLIKALPENIIFTAGGTEADNLAIYGIASAHEQKGKHIISLPIEHHAILRPLENLQKQGWEITYAKVDREGIIEADEIIKAIRPDTILISAMHANNEIGVIEPIAEIGRKLLRYRKANNTPYPYFHTDACQAAGYLNLDVEKSHVDLMTVNSGKIYGPKGVGVLYVRRGVKIKPQILGGSQENKRRAGTENAAGIVGFAKAFELAQKDKEKENERVVKLRDYLWERIQKEIPDVKLNGPTLAANGSKAQVTGCALEERRLPNNLNVTFMNIEGEALLLYLDEYGIMCSTGSACTSDSLDPSHVLTAIGLPYEYAHGSLRFTFGRCNTKQDVDYVMKYLPKIVETLREMSPVHLKGSKHPKYK